MGFKTFEKMSFPVHCGQFTEVETDSFCFHFNLNREIIRAKGKGPDWHHPHEWLKRRCSNSWVYYSTGGYTGVFEATGEYYLPNLQYPTNNLLGGDPFAQVEVQRIIEEWHPMLKQLSTSLIHPPHYVRTFLQNALKNNPKVLARKADEIFSCIGGEISVLPPDARHVDYNLIPLMISKGCLYKCQFCKVKNKIPFTEKSKAEIDSQIAQLKNIFKCNIQNYNSLYLGEHDGLQVNPDLLCYSIEESYREFGFADSFLNSSQIFMFGSVTSLLNSSEQLFDKLDHLPGLKYINIGLESADQETLDYIGKPLSEKLVKEAFWRAQQLNDRYHTIEITVNFIMADELPENHYATMLELIRHEQPRVKSKGTVYLSPLKFGAPSRKRLFHFNRLKVLSRLPTYLYIIQKL